MTIGYKIYIAVSHDPTWGAIGLFIGRVNISGQQNYHRLDPDAGWIDATPNIPHQAAVHLEAHEAKALAESLYAAGVRMDGELNSNGHRGALELHLSDMRKIVEAKLGVHLLK